MDGRMPLKSGAALRHGNKTYIVERLIGCGATSFVYEARYDDSLRGGEPHSVLLKELFPYHPEGLIIRGEQGAIVVPEEAETFFTLRKKSFLRGNNAHITLQNTRSDMTGVNIDSFEANGSVYTILGGASGETMRSILDEGTVRLSIPTVLHWIQRLLDALEVFHQNGLLHLDVSPDNILLMPLGEGMPERQRRLVLIDYNSVWETGALAASGDAYFCVKENYTAPEVRLGQRSSISAASDLFSVCAVLLELISGKPLDFSALYTGGQLLGVGEGLLKTATPAVKQKIAEILHQGLRLPPKRRFQSVGELRAELDELEQLVHGEDVLERTVQFFKRRAVVAASVVLLLAFLLSFAAIGIHESLSGYPRTTEEQYAADSAMADLASSLGRLGGMLESDLSVLSACGGDAARFREAAGQGRSLRESLSPKERYTMEALESYRVGASPIRFDLLLELLNAPADYRVWSDQMYAALSETLADGRYPIEDRQAIVRLYAQYAEAFADECYLKTQLVALPLNEPGERELLRALPYAPVFGEKLMAQSFGGKKTELESALTSVENRQKDLIVQLKGYGVKVE